MAPRMLYCSPLDIDCSTSPDYLGEGQLTVIEERWPGSKKVDGEG